MKSKILTLILCLFLPCAISAQQSSDGFFTYDYSERTRQGSSLYTTGDLEFQGMNHVVDAPLTDALMFLSLLSLTYFVIKRKKGVVR